MWLTDKCVIARDPVWAIRPGEWLPRNPHAGAGRKIDTTRTECLCERADVQRVFFDDVCTTISSRLSARAYCNVEVHSQPCDKEGFFPSVSDTHFPPSALLRETD